MPALCTRRYDPIFWVRAALFLGLALRAYHYLRNPSVWHDEAALMLNVIDKGYADLLGPLRFTQAAPPLFLWSEHTLSLLLGQSTFALRLLPFLASCLSLLLIERIAWRMLSASLVFWAVLLFACSDHLLWHACEAKPYAFDVLASTVAVSFFLWVKASTRASALVLRLLAGAALAPLLLGMSYPACFVCGGLLAALIPVAWRQRRPMVWASYLFLAFSVLISFGLLIAGPAAAQKNQELSLFWENAFPPLESVGGALLWTLLAFKDAIRYCLGPGCEWLILPVILGVGAFWRRDREMTVLLALPVVLALGASFFRAYPFNGTRMVVFATPALVLLSVEGVGTLWSRLAAEATGCRLARLTMRAALLAPLGLALFRVGVAWPRADCDKAAAFVRAQRQEEEPVLANHWEYAYYFRKLGTAFTLMDGSQEVTARRFWVVATAGTRADQQAVLASLRPGGWQVLRQEQFRRTTAFLCERQEGQ